MIDFVGLFFFFVLDALFRCLPSYRWLLVLRAIIHFVAYLARTAALSAPLLSKGFVAMPTAMHIFP